MSKNYQCLYCLNYDLELLSSTHQQVNETPEKAWNAAQTVASFCDNGRQGYWREQAPP